ncbi:hypothetical protein AVTE2539_17420 [Acidovorax sp. SUPP2539]|nr:hypothetical protein AVTE2539_17420 [Acidovorax sp. SUPP2539]
MPPHAPPQRGEGCADVRALSAQRHLGLAGVQLRERAEIELEAVVGLLPHAQIGHEDAAVPRTHAIKAVAEARHPLHGRHGSVALDQRGSALVHRPLHGPVAVGQGIETFGILGGRDRHHPPQQGVERGGRHQHRLHRQALRAQGGHGHAGDVLLHAHAPRQVERAERQAPTVPAGPDRRAARQRGDHADDQRHGVQRVDDEDAAHPVRVAGERFPQLGAVHRHAIQQRVGDEREPHRQPPPSPAGLLAMQARHQRAQGQRKQAEVQQGMAFRPVFDHVGNGVAMVDERVQVRQRAGHRPPQRGFPRGGAPAHHGERNGGTKGDLGQGIHGGEAGRGSRPVVSIGGVWPSRAGAPRGLRKNRAVAGTMAVRVPEGAADVAAEWR